MAFDAFQSYMHFIPHAFFRCQTARLYQNTSGKNLSLTWPEMLRFCKRSIQRCLLTWWLLGSYAYIKGKVFTQEQARH